jgi:AcrR family transcriptional regulator
MALTTSQLSALEKAFLAEGYMNITMSDIADAIGFTRRALYHHFSSKNEAFRGSVIFQNDRGLEAGCIAAARAMARGDSAIAIVHATLDARFGDSRRIISRSPHARELADAVFRLCGDIVNTMAARLHKELVALLKDLQKRRKIVLHPGMTPSRLAHMLVAGVRGVNQSCPLPKEHEFSLRYHEIIAAILGGSTKLSQK